MASTYLTRSVSSTGNRKKWTWSGWLKRGNLGAKYIMSSNNGSNQYSMLQFDSTNVLRYYDYTSDYQTQLKTTRVFRDINSWYHIVFAYDSAQSTEADRVKVYVNGTQETSFGTSSYPSQDYDSFMNLSGVPHYIGRETGTSNLYDGVMSHVHFTDGYAYAASDFGSTDSTTGEWKINTAPSVSYGTNGYFMFKDDNSVNDDSGNGNNFTLTAGTLTKTEDCPSNNFATLNPLLIYTGETDPVFSNGNTKVAPQGNSGRNYCISTLAMPRSGKYYAEFKKVQNDNVLHVGIIDTDIATTRFQANAYVKDASGGLVYVTANGQIAGNNTNQQTSLATAGNGDIIGLAIDMDNDLFYAYKNGTLLNTSGSGVDFSGFITGSHVAFFLGDGSSSGYDSCEANFGNGYFGTTAVSSAGTNASNNGIFEYDVPSGYTALSTKGLNL